jgi:hypothetical protein
MAIVKAHCWGQSVPSTCYDRYGNLSTISSRGCSAFTLSLTVNTENPLTDQGHTYNNAGFATRITDSRREPSE